ncbi:MAG: hypothetical protein R2860_15940 [Desulfobacterales bacterium]
MTAAERGNVSVSGAEEVDQGVGSDAGSSVLFAGPVMFRRCPGGFQGRPVYATGFFDDGFLTLPGREPVFALPRSADCNPGKLHVELLKHMDVVNFRKGLGEQAVFCEQGPYDSTASGHPGVRRVISAGFFLF